MGRTDSSLTVVAVRVLEADLAGSVGLEPVIAAVTR